MQLALHTSNVTRHTSHITHHTSHITHHLNRLQQPNDLLFKCFHHLPLLRLSLQLVQQLLQLFVAVAKSLNAWRWSHVTRNRGTRHTSHVTRHTSHVTRHTSHVTSHTSPASRPSVPRTAAAPVGSKIPHVSCLQEPLQQNHVISQTSQFTAPTSQQTRHSSHFTHYTSHITRHL
jgi:hypothetical protein